MLSTNGSPSRKAWAARLAERTVAIVGSILSVVTFFLHGSHALALWGLAFAAVAGITLWKGTRKLSLVLTALVLVVAGAVQLYVLAPRGEPFSVSIETALVSSTRDNSMFVLAFGGHFVSPIPVALFLRVVNRQSIPSTISTLDIQISSGGGILGLGRRWVNLSLLPTRYPLFSIGPQPGIWRRLTLPGPELRTALMRPLAPHETLRGWALLDAPAKFNVVPRPLIYRITLRDTAGRSLQTIINRVTASSPSDDIFRSHELDVGPEEPLPRDLTTRHFMYPF